MAKKLTQAQVRAVIKNEKVCLHGLRSGVRGSSSRLALGMPMGVPHRKTWARRQALALKAFEPQFELSRKNNGAGPTTAQGNKTAGYSPDEKFLKRVGWGKANLQ